ncbi:uncharacterized protein LOC112128276 [Cimex lectularius]|uniref:Uncharacterized protein n=1 Tax=Cimex lectularius TaxID=79782 RepID=A0A8I6SMS1_CIMLE|nr:uncharacterized protein LOC112128276 [Cimex lectularius]
MKSVLWCFVTALAAAASYNFADTEFNNFLDEELIEISVVSETPRSKRESDPENETTYSTTATPPETEVSQVPSVCRHHCRNDRRRMTYHHSHRYHGCCGRGSFRNARFMKASGDYMNERDCMREVMENIPNATNGNTDSFNIYSCEEVNRMKKKHVVSSHVMFSSRVCDIATYVIS